jgi:hypothetical protein
MKPQKQSMEPMVDVCDLLWKQIDKPSNLEMCKAINVYDNRYRINIYTRKYDQEFDIERVRITQSYFAQLDGQDLIIKA